MNGKFKLYKSIDYCEDSNVFLLIKDAIMEAWDTTNFCLNGGGHLYRVRSKIITPKTKIGDILLYVGPGNYEKKYFLNHFTSLLKTYFPGAKIRNWDGKDGFNIKESTKLLNIYNLLKRVPINSIIRIDENIKWVEGFSKKHYD